MWCCDMLRRCLKCNWCDDMCAPCGLDPDQIFAFRTDQKVRIKDRTLGGCSLLCLLGTIFYILYDCLMSERYLVLVQPDGAFTMSVMLPPLHSSGLTKPNCPGGPDTGPDRCCRDCPLAWPQALVDLNDRRYCSSSENGDPKPVTDSSLNQNGTVLMPCQYWDTLQFPLPFIGDSVLLTTRVTKQHRHYPCLRTFSSSAGTLRSTDVQCVRANYSDGYPPEPENSEEGFVAGVDDATIYLDHAISIQGSHSFSRRAHEMTGRLRGCDGEVIRTIPKWDATKDGRDVDIRLHRLLTLRELLGATRERDRCGVSLDEPALVHEADEAQLESCWEKAGQLARGELAFPVEGCGASRRYEGMVII
eukprot:Hpha_TRINITY_DN28695_c0_g1::TRINITY_DN28695_c0_g1_i1::g.156438::m.156438